MRRARSESSALLQSAAAGVPTRCHQHAGVFKRAENGQAGFEVQTGTGQPVIFTSSDQSWGSELANMLYTKKKRRALGGKRSPPVLARRGTISALGPLLNLFAIEEDLRDFVRD